VDGRESEKREEVLARGVIFRRAPKFKRELFPRSPLLGIYSTIWARLISLTLEQDQARGAWRSIMTYPIVGPNLDDGSRKVSLPR